MTGILIRRGDFDPDTHGENPCEDEGRDQGDASASQGTSNISSKPPATLPTP